MGKDLQVTVGFTYNALTNSFGAVFEIVPNLLPANKRERPDRGPRLGRPARPLTRPRRIETPAARLNSRIRPAGRPPSIPARGADDRDRTFRRRASRNARRRGSADGPGGAKFGDAFRGLKLGVRGHSSFFVHFFAAALVVAAGLVFRCAWWEWCVLLGCIGLVLTAELFNSAWKRCSAAWTRRRSERAGRPWTSPPAPCCWPASPPSPSACSSSCPSWPPCSE